jgi:hypothetical protein
VLRRIILLAEVRELGMLALSYNVFWESAGFLKLTQYEIVVIVVI